MSKTTTAGTKTHVQAESGDTWLRLEAFWKKYQKQLLIAIAAVVILIGGWYAYKSFVVQPKEDQAADAIYKAQANFAKDSLKTALNGEGTTRGFLYIIKNYDGTK